MGLSICEALDQIAALQRPVFCSPTNEAAVTEAIRQLPFAGLFKVVVTPACPDDAVYLGAPSLYREYLQGQRPNPGWAKVKHP